MGRLRGGVVLRSLIKYKHKDLCNNDFSHKLEFNVKSKQKVPGEQDHEEGFGAELNEELEQKVLGEQNHAEGFHAAQRTVFKTKNVFRRILNTQKCTRTA